MATTTAVGPSASASAAAPWCVPDDRASEVEAQAWGEIARLGADGYPVCDVVWTFFPDPNADGAAYPPGYFGDDRAQVNIDPGTGADISSMVRHEYGHVLTYAAGYTADDDAELRSLFVGELGSDVQDTTLPGFEVAGDAVAELLAPDASANVTYYVADVPAADLEAARAIVSAARAPRPAG